MTQELVNKLIAHYKKAIRDISKIEEKDVNVFLVSREIEYGLCSCARLIFKEEIYDDVWIRKKIVGAYICDIPLNNPKEEAIKLLKKRVKILRQFPN